MNTTYNTFSRRDFLGRLSTGLGGIALTSLLQRDASPVPTSVQHHGAALPSSVTLTLSP